MVLLGLNGRKSLKPDPFRQQLSPIRVRKTQELRNFWPKIDKLEAELQTAIAGASGGLSTCDEVLQNHNGVYFHMVNFIFNSETMKIAMCCE